MTRDPVRLRYTSAPLRGRARLPRDDRERAQRWADLLADKNTLITQLREEIARLHAEAGGLRKQTGDTP
jgi:dephospho-CoA kinase